jgi:hypothetical protein
VDVACEEKPDRQTVGGTFIFESWKDFEKVMSRLELIGIEDLFAPISCPVGILPLLPWLTQDGGTLIA